MVKKNKIKNRTGLKEKNDYESRGKNRRDSVGEYKSVATHELPEVGLRLLH